MAVLPPIQPGGVPIHLPADAPPILPARPPQGAPDHLQQAPGAQLPERVGFFRGMFNCVRGIILGLFLMTRTIFIGMYGAVANLANYLCNRRGARAPNAANPFAELPQQRLSVEASIAIVQEEAAQSREANQYPGISINFTNLSVGPLPIDLEVLERNLQGVQVSVDDLLVEHGRLFAVTDRDDAEVATERNNLQRYVDFVRGRRNTSDYTPEVSRLYFDSMTLVARTIAYILRQEFDKESRKTQLIQQENALRERGNIAEADRLLAEANAIVIIPSGFRQAVVQELAKAINNCDPRKRDDTLRQYRFLKIGESGQGGNAQGELLMDRLKAYSIFLDMDQAIKEDLFMETYPSGHTSNTLNYIRSEVGVALALDCDPINVNDPYRNMFRPRHRVSREEHSAPRQLLREFSKLYTQNRVIPALKSRVESFRNAEQGSHESAIENKFMAYIRSYHSAEVQAGRMTQEVADAWTESLIDENLDDYTYKLKDEAYVWIYVHFRKLNQAAGAQRQIPVMDVQELDQARRNQPLPANPPAAVVVNPPVENPPVANPLEPRAAVVNPAEPAPAVNPPVANPVEPREGAVNPAEPAPIVNPPALDRPGDGVPPAPVADAQPAPQPAPLPPAPVVAPQPAPVVAQPQAGAPPNGIVADWTRVVDLIGNELVQMGPVRRVNAQPVPPAGDANRQNIMNMNRARAGNDDGIRYHAALLRAYYQRLSEQERMQIMQNMLVDGGVAFHLQQARMAIAIFFISPPEQNNPRRQRPEYLDNIFPLYELSFSYQELNQQEKEYVLANIYNDLAVPMPRAQEFLTRFREQVQGILRNQNFLASVEGAVQNIV